MRAGQAGIRAEGVTPFRQQLAAGAGFGIGMALASPLMGCLWAIGQVIGSALAQRMLNR